MLFGLFGNNKKTPQTPKSNNPEASASLNKIEAKISSERKSAIQNTAKPTIQKSTDTPRPGPNGCADIATREED